MKKVFLVSLFLHCSCLINAQRFPSSTVPLPDHWNGAVFHLSQDYPDKPVVDSQPWLQYDFRKQPLAYLDAVYKYILEGNVSTGWQLSSNPVRKWFHAPWMHYRMEGAVDMSREPLFGLTRERDSRPFELSTSQEKVIQNWAVGFYNSPGGYTIGQVWQNHNSPDPSKAHFPYGTVAGKLVLTEADSIQVPYLEGAPSFDAYIFRNAGDPAHREVKKLHLLQFDVAVKDPRAANASGWIYGTFIFQNDSSQPNPWLRMLPVGLSWGNDDGLSAADTNTVKLSQCYINPAAKNIYQLGYAGRVNGPIDNRNSSCHSCHGAAAFPFLMNPSPDESMSKGERMHWFNSTANDNKTYFTASAGLDYSLQLAAGIQNFYDWKIFKNKRSTYSKILARLKPLTYAQVFIPTIILFVLIGWFWYKKPALFEYSKRNNNSYTVLLLRIGIGLLMISHGLPKLLGGAPSWIAIGQSMGNFGIYFLPLSWGFFSMLAELVGGLFILIGFCFRPVSIILAFNMLVAASTHLFSGQGIDAASHALTLFVIFLFLFFTWPGRFSADTLIYARKHS